MVTSDDFSWLHVLCADILLVCDQKKRFDTPNEKGVRVYHRKSGHEHIPAMSHLREYCIAHKVLLFRLHFFNNVVLF